MAWRNEQSKRFAPNFSMRCLDTTPSIRQSDSGSEIPKRFEPFGDWPSYLVRLAADAAFRKRPEGSRAAPPLRLYPHASESDSINAHYRRQRNELSRPISNPVRVEFNERLSPWISKPTDHRPDNCREDRCAYHFASDRRRRAENNHQPGRDERQE